MTSDSPNDSNAVEVDGIRFETLMPERVLTIPTFEQDVLIFIELGIRITNNTPTALRFSFHQATPELMMPSGQIQRLGGCFSDWLEKPHECDFPLVQSGEAVTLLPCASLNQCLGDLRFTIPAGNGGYWSFGELYPGTYKLRFEYTNNTPGFRVYDREARKNKLIENIWTGTVLMPCVEFSIVSRIK
ncbi:hypothetical protein [Microseira sp. BLCC-F43]|uniref:hypothetical protein n=1 Tax=Microseira sp. BLCC-F43 TaxID=3153602 RepID=UPI0035BAC74C